MMFKSSYLSVNPPMSEPPGREKDRVTMQREKAQP